MESPRSEKPAAVEEGEVANEERGEEKVKANDKAGNDCDYHPDPDANATEVVSEEDSMAAIAAAASPSKDGGQDVCAVCMESLISLAALNEYLQQRVHSEEKCSAKLRQRLHDVESQLHGQCHYSDALIKRNSEADMVASALEARMAGMKVQFSEVKKEIEILKRESTCMVCFEARREVLFLPCCHFHCCNACSTTLTECCYCKKPLRGKVQVVFQ